MGRGLSENTAHVVECLPSKLEALCSNPAPPKIKREREEKGKGAE
jgi:hypothetical protein